MTAQVLLFDVFFEKGPHLNAVQGASTSDGVQCSVFKPTYCTPSDMLARRNM